jgi:tetratricopeptide (TPR) repeat protein
MASIDELLSKTKQYQVNGNFKQAEKEFSDLINLGRKLNDPTLALILNESGINKRMLGGSDPLWYDKALEDFNDAFRFGNNTQKAYALTNMADIYRVAKSNFTKAHTSLDKALIFCDNGSLMYAKVVDQRGLVFVGQSKFNSAIESYKQAEQICDKLLKKNPKDKDVQNRYSQILHHLGVAYDLSDKKNKRNEICFHQINAYKIFKKLGDKQGMMNSQISIARIQAQEKKYDLSLQNYKKAFKISVDIKEKRSITALALEMGELYLQKKDTSNAEKFFNRFIRGIKKEQITNHDLNHTQLQNTIKRLNKIQNIYQKKDINLHFLNQVLSYQKK